MESEGKQRKIAKSWAGDVIVESALFKFQNADDKKIYELKEAPWAYIEDVPSHVISYLESLDE